MLQSSLLATLRRLGSAFGELWDGIERRHGLQGSQRREVTERRRSPSLPRSRVARGCLEIRNEMPAERLSQVRQRISALYRIPFVQPCHLQRVAGRRDAKICDLSAAGVYIALEPVPDVGEGFTISLPSRVAPTPEGLWTFRPVAVCAEQQLLRMKSFYWILLDLDCGAASLC
jgi:hypothetical protein